MSALAARIAANYTRADGSDLHPMEVAALVTRILQRAGRCAESGCTQYASRDGLCALHAYDDPDTAAALAAFREYAGPGFDDLVRVRSAFDTGPA